MGLIFDLRFLNIFHIEILAQLFFIQFAWQAARLYPFKNSCSFEGSILKILENMAISHWTQWRGKKKCHFRSHLTTLQLIFKVKGHMGQGQRSQGSRSRSPGQKCDFRSDFTILQAMFKVKGQVVKVKGHVDQGQRSNGLNLAQRLWYWQVGSCQRQVFFLGVCRIWEPSHLYSGFRRTYKEDIQWEVYHCYIFSNRRLWRWKLLLRFLG